MYVIISCPIQKVVQYRGKSIKSVHLVMLLVLDVSKYVLVEYVPQVVDVQPAKWLILPTRNVSASVSVL